MSLFGLGDQAPPSRSSLDRSASVQVFRRCESARGLRGVERSDSARSLSLFSNSANVADAVFSGHDAPRGADRPRATRRKTDLSASMRSSDSMREAMASPAPLSARLRSLRRPSNGVRRMSSCPSESPSPSNYLESLRGEGDSDYGGFQHRTVAQRDANRANWANVLRGTSPPPRRIASPSSSPRPTSARSRLSSMASMASSAGCGYNPRAKPGSIGSEINGAMSGRPASPCAQDHLWRDVFHSETDDKRVANLRGAGKAIGARGRSSAGMPWRQIPGYDSGGRLCETGDPHADRREIVKGSGMTEKRRAFFSPRLDQSSGVSELLGSSPMDQRLGILSENCENRPPPPLKIDSEAREAWLDVVKRRTNAKFDRVSPPRRVVSSTDAESQGPRRMASSPELTIPAQRQRQNPRPRQLDLQCDSVSVTTADDVPSPIHWSWRQLRKGKAADASDTSTKDTCPFYREDSNFSEAKMPSARSTSPNFSSAGVSLNAGEQRKDSFYPAEQVVEARRDWQFAQDKWDRDESLNLDLHAADSSALGSANSRSFLSRSASAQHFSSSNATAKTSRVHSVNSRAETPNGAMPRWK